jgi:ADP-glucose pyrophosphorylase
LQRYLDISLEMLAEQGLNFTAGKGLRLDPRASVTSSVLWDDVTIEEGAQVHQAVLADNVHVFPNEIIKNSVVVPRALVEGRIPPEKAQKGFFQGESFVVPLSG